MKTQKHQDLGFGPIILPVFVALMISIFLTFTLDYRPFLTFLSQISLNSAQPEDFPNERAILSLRRATDLSPDNCIAQLRLGEIYILEAFDGEMSLRVPYDANLVHAAERSFIEAINRCPDTEEGFLSLYRLANLYYLTGDYSSALARLVSGAKVAPLEL